MMWVRAILLAMAAIPIWVFTLPSLADALGIFGEGPRAFFGMLVGSMTWFGALIIAMGSKRRS